jgi:hypothetical protein
MSQTSHQTRKFFKKHDLFLIALLIIIAVAIYFFTKFATPKNDSISAEIYYNSKLIETIDLPTSLSEKISVHGNPNVVLEIKNGKIRFFDSDCRDKICIKAGFLDSPGQAAACLPNRVAIKIISNGNTNTNQADVYAT